MRIPIVAVLSDIFIIFELGLTSYWLQLESAGTGYQASLLILAFVISSLYIITRIKQRKFLVYLVLAIDLAVGVYCFVLLGLHWHRKRHGAMKVACLVLLIVSNILAILFAVLTSSTLRHFEEVSFEFWHIVHDFLLTAIWVTATFLLPNNTMVTEPILTLIFFFVLLTPEVIAGIAELFGHYYPASRCCPAIFSIWITWSAYVTVLTISLVFISPYAYDSINSELASKPAFITFLSLSLGTLLGMFVHGIVCSRKIRKHPIP